MQYLNINLTSLSQVRELLANRRIRPSRKLGQNFLIDANILNIILNAAELNAGDNVLEIGGGLGVLTERLASAAGKVVCVEKDYNLYALLKQRLDKYDNLKIIRADMTELSETDFNGRHLNKAAANLPYSAGSRIIVDLCNWNRRPDIMVFTVQRDVAMKIIACAGGKNYGLLSILTQSGYNIKLVKDISPSCFFPVPKITSSVLKMTRRTPDIIENKPLFLKLIRFAFSRRRKQINTIIGELPGNLADLRPLMPDILAETGVSPKARPEQITVEQWCAITNRVSKKSGV